MYEEFLAGSGTGQASDWATRWTRHESGPGLLRDGPGHRYLSWPRRGGQGPHGAAATVGVRNDVLVDVTTGHARLPRGDLARWCGAAFDRRGDGALANDAPTATTRWCSPSLAPTHRVAADVGTAHLGQCYRPRPSAPFGAQGLGTAARAEATAASSQRSKQCHAVVTDGTAAVGARHCRRPAGARMWQHQLSKEVVTMRPVRICCASRSSPWPRRLARGPAATATRARAARPQARRARVTQWRPGPSTGDPVTRSIRGRPRTTHRAQPRSSAWIERSTPEGNFWAAPPGGARTSSSTRRARQHGRPATPPRPCTAAWPSHSASTPAGPHGPVEREGQAPWPT